MRLSALHTQELADLIGQWLIRRAAEDLELIVVPPALRLVRLGLCHLLVVVLLLLVVVLQGFVGCRRHLESLYLLAGFLETGFSLR
jgi:hypothetical protein